MRLTLLGSGSAGNVALLEAGPAEARTRVLLDAGLSRRELSRRLQRVTGPDAQDCVLERLDALLVTHDHADHAGHAAAYGLPTWATAGTRRRRSLEAERVISGRSFRVGALEVLPVLLPHDAAETVGYVLSDGAVRVGLLTDCGHDAPEVAEAYAGCDVLVLEANHDEAMLRLGPYRPCLKRRVAGPRGHLSNAQSAALLAAMARHRPAPRLVIAAHLSQANNRPELARRALEPILGSSDRLLVATQGSGAPSITVSRDRVEVATLPGAQLALDWSEDPDHQEPRPAPRSLPPPSPGALPA